jgi:hypothetical protein
MVEPIHNNKNVDIKFSAHDTFLEWPSSDILKIERLKSPKIHKCLGEINPNGLKR